MDVDQEGSLLDGKTEPGGQVVLPGTALPGIIQILPQQHRPFFPGQAIPLIMSAETWLPTLEAIRKRGDDVIGLIATKHNVEGVPVSNDLYDMGCLCKIHRVHHEGDQLQVLLEGIQRFQVRKWVSGSAPMAASVRYFPDPKQAQSSEETAYAVAIINTIKELIPLNPLYGEELKVFLTRSNPNEPALLADFAAGLTTASKAELQEVLERITLQPRLGLVVKLLRNEVEIAAAQMEIREHVEQEIQGHQREAVLRQQLIYIQKELGISKDDKTAEVEDPAQMRIDVVFKQAEKIAQPDLRDRAYLDLADYATSKGMFDQAKKAALRIKQVELRDTARSRIAMGMARYGLADEAFALIAKVEVKELKDVMRLQVIEALLGTDTRR